MAEEPRGFARWLPWLIGAALCGTVVIAALRRSEQQQFVGLLGRASVAWLSIAFALQAATYAAQATAWWIVVRASDAPMSAGFAYQLSLTKLFLDQALPSAGISGTVVVAHAMERHDVPRPVVMAAVVVETTTYYTAYVVALLTALGLVAARGHLHPLLLLAGAMFAMFATLVAATFLALAGRERAPRGWLAERKHVRRVLDLVRGADRGLSRSPRLLALGLLLQLAIVLLDAATIWACVRGLGAHGSPSGIFASFMVSTLLRTIGLVPGGLGTFEAASVVTLGLTGLSTAVALEATLLFRGLSFWLPMLPGILVSRRLARATESRSA